MRSAGKWTILAILSFALALISLDNTIVNVALPSLQEDLKATSAQLQWVVDAYSVLFAGTLLLAGSLGDRFGRKKLLLIGLVIFGAGSLAAGAAPDANVLIICRAIMGIGGAFIMPSTLSILVQTFTAPTERAQAIGIWAAVAGVGVAIGPIAGGALLEHFSWHSVFLVNPPLVVIVLLLAIAFIPESLDESKPQLDVRGAALSALGLIALVTFIVELPDSGLTTVTLTAGLAALVLLTAFVWWEKRAPRPILPMELFKERLFTVAVVLVGLVYFALMGALFFLPQFLQLVQGMTPLESGASMLPGAGGLLVASLLSPRLAEKWGARPVVVVGVLLVTLGLLAMSLVEPMTSYPYVGVALGITGVGMGLTLPQATNGILSCVPRERSGMGSAVNESVSELGGSFGVAILGGILAFFYRSRIDETISSAPDAAAAIPEQVLDTVRESLAAASVLIEQLPATLANPSRDIVAAAFVTGMGWALVTGAAITLLGAILAWRYFPQRMERVEE
ncbi:MAG TPA: MFS transporter [Candidatus Nanopelagicales bacterium]|nr:MFS transporter [Candidatus Nanopelagicales bacterium]